MIRRLHHQPGGHLVEWVNAKYVRAILLNMCAASKKEKKKSDSSQKG